VRQIPDAIDTVVYAPDDEWKYHSKQVKKFPDINKLCDVASCWIYEYIGILLGARPILHISSIKVKGLVFITVVKSVYSAVRTDSLYKAEYILPLKGYMMIYKQFSFRY
jgi:hypothetical protein